MLQTWVGEADSVIFNCSVSCPPYIFLSLLMNENIMSTLQCAINLFLLHAYLIPFMIIYVGYGTCFYFGRVSLPRYYYLYKDQCWCLVASVCQVIAW